MKWSLPQRMAQNRGKVNTELPRIRLVRLVCLRRQVRYRHIEIAAVCTVLMCFMAMPIAQGQQLDDLTLDQMSVRELMRLDTALALSQSRSKLEGAAKGLAKSGQSVLNQVGDPRLIAIYGVGKKLMAEVIVGSHPFVYMHGRALPVGVKSSTTAFRLRGITGSCIQLERQDESHNLCLNPSLSMGG